MGSTFTARSDFLYPSAGSHIPLPPPFPISGASPSPFNFPFHTSSPLLHPTLSSESPPAPLDSSSYPCLSSSYSTTPQPPLSSAKNKRKDSGHVPRPRNSFIIFRSLERSALKRVAIGANEQNISKVAAELWRKKTPEEKAYYKHLEAIQKQEHQMRYPGWKYHPKPRDHQRKNRKKSTRPGDEERNSLLVACRTDRNSLAETKHMVDEFDRCQAASQTAGPCLSLPHRGTMAESCPWEESEEVAFPPLQDPFSPPSLPL